MKFVHKTLIFSLVCIISIILSVDFRSALEVSMIFISTQIVLFNYASLIDKMENLYYADRNEILRLNLSNDVLKHKIKIMEQLNSSK